MARTMQGLVSEIRRRNGNLRRIADRMDAYGRNEGDLDWSTMKSLAREAAEIEDLGAELEEMSGSSNVNPMALFHRDAPLYHEFLGRPSDQLFSDGSFKSVVEKMAVRENVAKGIPIGIQGPFNVEIGYGYGAMKTGLAPVSGASANPGPLVRPDRTDIFDVGPFQRSITLIDLINPGETSSDKVEYVVTKSFTNNAAVQPEPSATASGQTGQSEVTFGLETEDVKTISHFIPASRRLLNDAPNFRMVVDQFLAYGVDEKLETQIAVGDGVGENFTGYRNTSGIGSQSYDTNIIKTARKARTKVKTEGRARATAYVFNPADWESYDLSVDGESRYLFGGPTILGVSRLWGLPVVESEAQTVTKGMVADWRLATLWRHVQPAQMMLSDSHEDYFTRGLIALLLEKRMAFALIRPAAFIEFNLS